MKAKIIPFLVIFMLICLVSCTGQTDQNEPLPPNSHVDAPLSQDGQEYAYFTVFEDLFEKDPALNHESVYLAVDLTNTQLANTEPIIALIQDFCDDNGYTLLLDTIDGLMEKGYIKDLHFEEGFVIAFADIELDTNRLVTSAMKWRSGLGAIGADYTVEQNNGTWEITEMSNNWIS